MYVPMYVRRPRLLRYPYDGVASKPGTYVHAAVSRQATRMTSTCAPLNQLLWTIAVVQFPSFFEDYVCTYCEMDRKGRSRSNNQQWLSKNTMTRTSLLIVSGYPTRRANIQVRTHNASTVSGHMKRFLGPCKVF